MNIEAISSDLDKACSAVESDLTELYEKLSSSDSPLHLHHYTTIEGLRGILNSREIWATGVEYLNDLTEMSHGVQLARTIIDEETRRWDNAEHWAVRDILFRVRHELGQDELQSSHFVSCFCVAPDLLSQWRAYGPNGGFCLAFDVPEFQRSALNEGGTRVPVVDAKSGRLAYLTRVLYDAYVQSSIVSETIRSYLEAFHRLVGQVHLNEASMDQSDQGFIGLAKRFASRVSGRLLQFTTIFKHPSFVEEHEWRLVHRRKADDIEGIEFRTGRGSLIPYIRVGFDAERCLSSITCGPQSNALSERSIRVFMLSRGLGEKPIYRASAPLRF